jgi:hypothetical protein
MLPGKADIGRPLAGELAGADARGSALRCCGGAVAGLGRRIAQGAAVVKATARRRTAAAMPPAADQRRNRGGLAAERAQSAWPHRRSRRSQLDGERRAVEADLGS